MTSYNALAEIVGAAKQAAPLPEDYRDLNAQSRRRVEREAAEAGVTPQQFWKAILDAERADAAFEAHAIAKDARR